MKLQKKTPKRMKAWKFSLSHVGLGPMFKILFHSKFRRRKMNTRNGQMKEKVKKSKKRLMMIINTVVVTVGCGVLVVVI